MYEATMVGDQDIISTTWTLHIFTLCEEAEAALEFEKCSPSHRHTLLSNRQKHLQVRTLVLTRISVASR